MTAADRVEALERRQRIDAEKYRLSLEQYLALEGAFKALERELAENAATTQLFIASVVRAAECEDGMVVDAIAGLRQDRDTALTELDTTRRLLEQVDACHGKPLDDVILPLNDAMHAVHAFLAPAADEEVCAMSRLPISICLCNGCKGAPDDAEEPR